ncbi:MAG: HAMP domain-containing sensor histidine kinase [Elusimicrobiota bacterium]
MTAKYLLLFRVILLLTVVLQSLYAPEAEKGVGWLISLCVGYGACAVLLYILESQGILKTQWSPWTFIIDILVTVLALYKSPGHSTDYYLAFFVVVLSSTLLNRPAFSFLIAGVVCFIYGHISLAEYDSIYHPEKLMNLAILMVTAFFSTFMADQARTVESAAKGQYEEQLAWMKHLSTVGKALTGVLHEVKTPLGTIVLNVEYVRELLRGGKDVAEPLLMIEQEAERASEILRNFLEFTKPSQLALSPLPAAEPLMHVLETLRVQLEDREIVVVRELDDGVMIAGSRRHLVQLFTNIVINAVEAMPLGGTLAAVQETAGGRVRLRFTDTGDGIAPEKLQALFEPFQTSRDKAGGSGLGLSIVRWIAQKHDGEVRIESPGVGRGTTVAVEFPALES